MDDPTRPSLTALADLGHAFAIPWSHDMRAVLAGFDSSRMLSQKGPWVTESPFDPVESNARQLMFEGSGGSSTFRDAFSGRSESSTDHLSAGGSIGVGAPFLSAEVSVDYDKTVIENSNGVQASRNASCRLGRLILEQFPRLSDTALALLESDNGHQEFKKVYGDYFVRGYSLGANSGVCLSADTHSRSEKETLKITVTVKVLFVKASATHTETSESLESSASMNLCGYTTLDNASETLKTTSASFSEQAKVQTAAAKYMALVGSMEQDAQHRLKKLDLTDHRHVHPAKAFDACRSGLVVQLLLFPFARLEQYLETISRPKSQLSEGRQDRKESKPPAVPSLAH